MKKKYSTILMILLAVLFALMMCACGKGAEPADTAEPAETEEEPPAETETAEVVDFLEEIDTEDTQDIPLQIESITLFEDGSLKIVPTGDLLKNAETNNEVVDGGVYPFADSGEKGEVKAFYLVRYGNGGYRTLICLMDDGTLSALSANELINDRIFIVMDNLTGRDTYVKVKEVEYEDAFGVVGVTEDGEEIDLDFSLDF